ncbi:hypothetical protein F511_20451 [Dorcoceras hygrometricum]|uniref:Uncharacterized protein n=1 Tax=Dorcoceras hygrometricum TaxID=472368 RepID=A0A2Z7A3A6_9LAMI|nr:hypothetical protein F511_20451 [Dorcoceras hygrometricum]
MSLFDLQDVCIAIGSLATIDLPMVVDLIGIYGLKGPYCTLTTTNWFLQALSVIPRGSWGDVARRSYHDPMGKSGIVIPEPQCQLHPAVSCMARAFISVAICYPRFSADHGDDSAGGATRGHSMLVIVYAAAGVVQVTHVSQLIMEMTQLVVPRESSQQPQQSAQQSGRHRFRPRGHQFKKNQGSSSSGSEAFTTATPLCPTDRIAQEAISRAEAGSSEWCVHKSKMKTKQLEMHKKNREDNE